MPTMRLTQQDQGRAVSCKVGDAIAIELPDNATTGFQWRLRASSTDLLDVADPISTSPAGAALGVGGVVRFAVQPRAAGSATVTVGLSRGASTDAMTLHFRFTIEE